LVKWLKKTTNQRVVSKLDFERAIQPKIAELVTPGVAKEYVTRGSTVSVRIDYTGVVRPTCIDSAGKALIDPPERENIPEVCRTCDQLEFDRTAPIANSPAYAWRHLGLVEADGTPTTRGIIFSFFHGGEGLAIAAALEDETYPISDLIYDLANIRAGPRFAGEDAPMGGRLGILCQRVYRELIVDPRSRHKLTSDLLRHGDIERALIEWRSLLRHIVAAPDYDLERWRELKKAAADLADVTASPALIDLPPLLATQQRR
jgi:hypothetical protein